MLALALCCIAICPGCVWNVAVKYRLPTSWETAADVSFLSFMPLQNEDWNRDWPESILPPGEFRTSDVAISAKGQRRSIVGVGDMTWQRCECRVRLDAVCACTSRSVHDVPRHRVPALDSQSARELCRGLRHQIFAVRRPDSGLVLLRHSRGESNVESVLCYERDEDGLMGVARALFVDEQRL